MAPLARPASAALDGSRKAPCYRPTEKRLGVRAHGQLLAALSRCPGGCFSEDQETKELGRRLPGSSLPAGVPPDSVARGGGAVPAMLTGCRGGGHCAMAGAEGLMSEVSWKLLERRARAKRSGLTACDNNLPPAGYRGWCSSASPLEGGRWDLSWGSTCVLKLSSESSRLPCCPGLVLLSPHSLPAALPSFRKLLFLPEVIFSPKLVAS